MRNSKKLQYRLSAFLIVLLLFPSLCHAEYEFEGGASLNIGAGSNDFAPLYLRANRHGKITQSKNVQLNIWAEDSLDLSKRFDFSWGVEALGGYSNRVDYRRFNEEWLTDPSAQKFLDNPQGPAAIWLQQLYAEVKWRCLFLSLGLKDRDSFFVDQALSSGDLLWSGNSRSIPEARVGFVDFQDIPFTKKWVQFDIALSYGKFMDKNWIYNHFDYWNGKMNPGSLWTYKRLAIRTNPTKPFMFQGGVQLAGIFGGTTYYYGDGKLNQSYNNYSGFKDYIQMLFPFWSNGREGYRLGDTKGTYDIAVRYRFKTDETLRLYVQWFFEDSSGIAKQNGFDGLWGAEFKFNRNWWINGIVAEYLDLTHMSGPLAYDPKYEGENYVPHKADGRDAYYNNYYYRSYVNYGLNMGTPMVQGILFDTGKEKYAYENGIIPYFRVRAFHLGFNGTINNNFDYIVKFGYRKAWGDTNKYTLVHPVSSTNFMVGANYRFDRLPGLSLSAAIGVDHGTLPSNSFGGMVTLAYERPFIFSRK